MQGPNLKIAFRNLYYQGLSTVINTAGLVAGLTTAIFVLLFILNELSFDKLHLNRDRIYRVTEYNHTHKWMMATTPYPLGEILVNESPAVEKAVCIERISPVNIRKGREWINEENMYSAGPELFDIFTFPLIYGEPGRLAGPDAAVMSEKSAEKFFGTRDPVGESVEIMLSDTIILLEVVAVMKDPPRNLTFRPEIIVSAELGLLNMSENMITTGGSPPTINDIAGGWEFNFFTTYIMLKEGADTSQVSAAFRSLEEQYYGDEKKHSFHNQALKDIYLGSGHLINNFSPQGERQVIYIFTGIGLLIVLISLLNYILLYGGLTITRIKEFALRRIAGATGKNLFLQIITETLLIVILVLPVCLVLVELLRPAVSGFLEKQIVVGSQIFLQYAIGVFLIILLVGMIPGVSMVSFISGIRPVAAFKADKIPGRRWISPRMILVFCQFIAFNILIICSLGIMKQVQYPMKTDMGFQWENLIKVRVNQTGSLSAKFAQIKNDLIDESGIHSISGGMFIPPTNSVMSINLNKLDGSDETVNLEALFVDQDFIETMGINMAGGRSISEFPPGGERKILINQAAREALGIEQPIGEKIMGGEITGIVDDFNTHTFHREIPPTMIIGGDHNLRDMIIRIDPLREPELRRSIIRSVREFFPDSDPELITIEDELKDLYKKERITAATIGVFTGIAILIGAMGLFGISMHTIQRRKKEFAIRKVHGARSNNIISLLAKYYLLLALATLGLASPISVYLLDRWLQNFVYRATLSWWIFALSGTISLAIIVVTAGIHVLHAARTKPADSLRYE